MKKIIGVIIALLLVVGALFFFVFSPLSESGEDMNTETAESGENNSTDSQEEESTEKETTEESAEEQKEESTEESEESTEEQATGEQSSEESDQASSTEGETTEDNTSEEATKEESTKASNKSSNSNNYTAAEQCIMSELTECQGVSVSSQFQAYKDLVADGTLPQAPGSGCLACAVKYSFEEKYGESRDIEAQPSDGGTEDVYTGSPEALVSEYLFSLPAYYNGANELTLNYLLPESNAYNQLTANKASGDFRDHMTYTVFIETVEPVTNNEYNVYAYREYSHENSGGVYEAYVRYNIAQKDGRYYITDYTELRNVPVQ